MPRRVAGHGGLAKSPTMTDRIFTRVVIACDSAGENRSSIEAAARLATWLDAALHGIFVEDQALFNLAALPFARHVGATGEIFRSIDQPAISHHFTAQAIRIRAALEMAANEKEVAWTFDIIRGSPSNSSLDIGDQDLLVIEAQSRPFAGTLRLDSRWLATAFETHRSILLLRGGDNTHDIVALVQANGPTAFRLVTTAAKLAASGDRSLTLLIANDTIDTEGARKTVGAVSEKLAAKCRIGRITARALANTRGSLLLVDADPMVNDAAALKELLSQTRADVLFLHSH